MRFGAWVRALVIGLLASGCGAQATVEQTPPNSPAVAVPDAGSAPDAGVPDFQLQLDPGPVPVGREFVIRGATFHGPNWGPQQVWVQLGGAVAEITDDSSDTELAVLVRSLPGGAASGQAQSVRLEVATPDGRSSWAEVEVLPAAEPPLPDVTHIDVGAAASLPNVAVEGSTITLFGVNFGSDAQQVSVSFDGAPTAGLHPETLSGNQMTVQVPAAGSLAAGVLRQVVVRVQVGAVVSPGKKLWVQSP